MKKSTVSLIKGILFGVCGLTFLSDTAAGSVSPLRNVMAILCAAVSVLFLVQYAKNRRAEKEEQHEE